MLAGFIVGVKFVLLLLGLFFLGSSWITAMIAGASFFLVGMIWIGFQSLEAIWTKFLPLLLGLILIGVYDYLAVLAGLAILCIDLMWISGRLSELVHLLEQPVSWWLGFTLGIIGASGATAMANFVIQRLVKHMQLLASSVGQRETEKNTHTE